MEYSMIQFILGAIFAAFTTEATPPFYRCINTKDFALTFDDGPHPSRTVEVLDVLKELGVKSTFFIQGYGDSNWEPNATRYEETIGRVFAEGHQIGSHTFSHPDMTNITLDEIRRELSSLDNLILKIIGVRPTIFRPPYGNINDQLLQITEEEFGYFSVLWNIDTMDWAHPGDTVAGMGNYYKALNDSRHESFIGLHHDVQFGSANLARAAINFMRESGFRLVTVSECIGRPMFQETNKLN